MGTERYSSDWAGGESQIQHLLESPTVLLEDVAVVKIAGDEVEERIGGGDGVEHGTVRSDPGA